MRTFLLTLCAAALLAGCSDDTTDSGSGAPVVGKAQFAAAIDDFSAETRISIADGMTTWEAGDRIGITGMIDGTPYVKNVPYEFAAATSFGELAPVSEPILWNESVAGERSFFACWPYKASDDQYPELNCALFGFSVPAVQTVTNGVNDAKPVLIGSAKTSAQTQRPIALRFKNLFAVLNLRFERFAQTSVSQIVIEPAPDAVLTGYLSAEGAIANTGAMTIDQSSSRITINCAGEGLDIAGGASIQVPVGRFTVTGGLKFITTTTDGRTFSEIIFVDEEWSSYFADEAGDFHNAKYVNHTVALEVVSDEVADGVVYFEDNLDWITASERWTNNSTTGGGWPTVTTASSATGKANYFTVDLIPDFTTKGYVKSVQRTSVQARYEGYLCLGTTGAQGALITPALTQIGDTPTDILVSFYGASYASENLMADGKPLAVKVLGAGTIGDEDAASAEVEITNYYRWHKYWLIVKGATSATQIQFGQDVAQSVGRVLLDNILIGKAVKGAVAGDREVEIPVVPYLSVLGTPATELENEENATGSCIIQSNLPWIATTEAVWLSVTPAEEYNGTGIAYKITVTAQSVNTTGKIRTAEVTFTAGELTKTVTFTQTEKIPENVILEDDFAWTKGDGTRGAIPEPNPEQIASTASIGGNGTKYDKWSTKDYLKYGWISPVNDYAYAKDGMLGFGIAATPGGIVSPALAGIGNGTMDIVVEFDILEYKNPAETGKTIFAVYEGAGTISAFSGHYTSVAGDTFTNLSADKKTQHFYCGNYAGWISGAYWHHIVVRIDGANKDTKLQLQGWGTGIAARFWLDNFKVTQKK